MSLWSDFCAFATKQIHSKDIDPAYPVLRYVLRHDSREIQLWKLFLYLTYYNLTSAEEAWADTPEPSLIGIIARPTGVERRGMRSNPDAVRACISSFLNATDGHLGKWVQQSIDDGGWTGVRIRMQSVWGVGPWASFKWADLLKNVLDYPMTCPDIGVGGGSLTAGPVPGLALLTGATPENVLTVQQLQHDVYASALREGVPFTGIDQFETALCDFNSLVKGTYYVGHDIDLMMEGLSVHSPFWDARARVFHHSVLGEVHGWHGVRKELKTVYRDTGVL